MLRLWFTYIQNVAELQGLSLSGGDEKKAQDQLKEGVKSQYPLLTGTLFVGSDTHGALATALPSGRLRVLFFYAAHIFQCFHTVLMGSNQDSRPMDSPYKNDVYPQSTQTHVCVYTRMHAHKETHLPTSFTHPLSHSFILCLGWRQYCYAEVVWREECFELVFEGRETLAEYHISIYDLGEVIPDVRTDKVR